MAGLFVCCSILSDSSKKLLNKNTNKTEQRTQTKAKHTHLQNRIKNKRNYKIRLGSKTKNTRNIRNPNTNIPTEPNKCNFLPLSKSYFDFQRNAIE